MNWIFEIEDKSRRRIHLSKEQWKHIVTEHSDLANKIEDIKDTLTNPLTIKPSKYDENVRWYFRYNKKISKYLMVSVKYLNGEGFIITAFHISKLSK